MKKYTVIFLLLFSGPAYTQPNTINVTVPALTASQSKGMELKQLNDESFKNNLLKDAMIINKERISKSADRKTESITFMVLKEPVKLNCLVLKEAIQRGQTIKLMDIILSNHGIEVKKITVTTIGRKRVITFPAREVTELSFVVVRAKTKPHISSIEGFLIDEKLVEKE